MKFLQSCVNCKGLKAALGFGVTSLWNSASIASGTKGVNVIVGVSVTAGVFVTVGVSVIVGDNVMVGETVMVGVNEGVSEGGKY